LYEKIYLQEILLTKRRNEYRKEEQQGMSIVDDSEDGVKSQTRLDLTRSP
jgi:hypothetical protein